MFNYPLKPTDAKDFLSGVVLIATLLIVGVGTGALMVWLGIESLKMGDVVLGVIILPMGAGTAGIFGLPVAWSIVSMMVGKNRRARDFGKLPGIVLVPGKILFGLSVLVFLLGCAAGGLGVIWRGVMPLREGNIAWWGIFLIVVGVFMMLLISAIVGYLVHQAHGWVF